MAVLKRINGPDDVKRLTDEECRTLSEELRQTIIETVSRQGGHLASNLGIVDLTIALHRTFDSPKDKLIFDVGHQVYAHKLLTGRQDRFSTLRSYHGMSGFPCQEESPHDHFDTGHSSTAISMALGMARARDLAGEDYDVVAVVGDGALTGGMCYEAMNDAGNGHNRLIVILNDNAMSISPNVGALSDYFKRLRASASWYGNKKRIKVGMERIPLVGKPLARFIENAKNMVKSVTTGGELFEALGFRYLGPFDGHDIKEMSHVLEEARQIRDMPVLIHVVTTKGNGYDLAEQQPEKYHGTPPFRVETGLKKGYGISAGAAQMVGDTLVAMAAEDKRVVTVTAAMGTGTGLQNFKQYFPERFFDVGIAEQHAVSMAAGMAKGGYRPFFAVYATFFQRAYDQMIHDVCLQNLPVCILADHMGLVGDDGKTHHGVFVLPMALSMPGVTVLIPRDAHELQLALRSTLQLDGPSIICYPKEGIEPYARSLNGDTFAVGHWQWLREGTDGVILAISRMTMHAMEAAEILEKEHVSLGVIDCCSLKPMDLSCIRSVFSRGVPVMTLEEGQVIGGMGSEIARLCVSENLPEPACIVGLPDRFVTHGSVRELLAECRLLPEDIAERWREILKKREAFSDQKKEKK